MIEFEFPQEIDNLDSEFSSKLEKRRDKLIEQLLARNVSENVCVRCFSMKTKSEKFLSRLAKDLKKRKNIKIDSDNCTISVKNEASNRLLFSASYFVIAYYDCFFNLSDSVKRYVFFEIYFEDHIFSVLMKKSYYNSNNNAFTQFDMDKHEFAMAKKQIEFWQTIIALEPYTYAPISVDAKKLIEFYDDVKNTKHPTKKIRVGYKSINESNILILYLMAYTSIVNLIPLLNSELIPKFVLNLVCSSDDQVQDLLPALRQIISIFSFNDMVRDVPVITGYSNQDDEPLMTDDRQIFILSYSRESDLKYCINSFEEHVFHNKKGYPINRIPVCIGPMFFAESCILNVKLDKGLKIPRFSKDPVDCIKEMVIAGFSKLFDAKKYEAYVNENKYYTFNEVECKLKFLRSSLSEDLNQQKKQIRNSLNEKVNYLTSEYYTLFSCLELIYGNFNEQTSEEKSDATNILHETLISIDQELLKQDKEFKKLYEILIAMQSRAALKPLSKAEAGS